MTNEAILDDLLKKGRGKKARSRFSTPNARATGLKTIASPKSVGALYLTAKRLPQSILKITSFGKGHARVLDHLSYISRGGSLTLEDQDGHHLTGGISDHKDLLTSWSGDFGSRVNSRDTLHLMVSAPRGSSADAVEHAARSFLSKTFADKHSYLFAVHTDTDKPHVHVCLKLMNEEGRKLNPRKDMLETWRAAFAKECREQKILVEASRRFERGIYGKNLKDSVRQAQNRGVVLSKGQTHAMDGEKTEMQANSVSSEKEAKFLARNRAIRRRYIEAARKTALQATQFSAKEAASLIEIAKTLDDFAKAMPSKDSDPTKSFSEYVLIKSGYNDKGLNLKPSMEFNSQEKIVEEVDQEMGD